MFDIWDLNKLLLPLKMCVLFDVNANRCATREWFPTSTSSVNAKGKIFHATMEPVPFINIVFIGTVEHTIYYLIYKHYLNYLFCIEQIVAN